MQRGRPGAMHAFQSHVSLAKRARCSPAALCARRALLHRKRPRRRAATVRAMFIWSSEGIFGQDDDEKASPSDEGGTDDAADEDDVRDLPGDVYDHPVFGKAWARGGDDKAGEDDDPGEGAPQAVRALLKALGELTAGPDDVDAIRGKTSDDAADAFRRIVVGIFGSIPGDAFEVIVNTDQTGVQRLMQSALATGYALRNAEWRMAASEALAPRKPEPAQDAEPAYMRDVPRRGAVRTADVAGDVQWWDSVKDERREMPAAEYVAKLEAENELLRERLQAARAHGQDANRILDYMRTVSPEKIAQLQQEMGADALECFKITIRRVLGDLAADKVQITYSTSRDYIGQLAFWCLLVGYHVRILEKKIEMQRLLEAAEPVAFANEKDA